MKIELIHGENMDIIGVLNVKKERLDEIMKAAQKNMMEKHPRGTKGRFLEFVINECKTVNEVVAATISWKEITDHMQRVAMEKAYNKSKIIKPSGGAGIIRPLG